MSAAIPITRLDHTASELRSFAGKCGDGAQVFDQFQGMAWLRIGHGSLPSAGCR